MMTEIEPHLAYAEAQIRHPNPQLRPFVAWLYGLDLPQLRSRADAERQYARMVDRGHIEGSK